MEPLLIVGRFAILIGLPVMAISDNFMVSILGALIAMAGTFALGWTMHQEMEEEREFNRTLAELRNRFEEKMAD